MEVDLYSTIEYTPGWYYSKYPGFWNVHCYKILSDYSFHPEKYTTLPEEGVEETKTSMDVPEEPPNEKKRKLEEAV